jgi:hypothetical protein
VSGIREGLNKFLSNAFLSLDKRSKYLKGNFYSLEALNKVNVGDFKGLVYEHMVPKSKYIQKRCENAARERTLTIEYINDLLDKYWFIAVITKDEDTSLRTFDMPNDWDGKNIFQRYQEAKISLVQSPFMSTNDEWNNIMEYIDLSKDNAIYNTSGEVGEIVIINCNLSVVTKNRTYVYDDNSTITDVQLDGWVLGSC